jgi:uncharacterized protein YacL
MIASIWVIRIFFLALCTVAGYAVSQYRPELIQGGVYGVLIGLGLGAVVIGIDHMLKGFSLRAFSAATFGLMLGTLVAWLVDGSGLFVYVQDEKTTWLIRLGLFLSFGYLGMVLAMRGNKEDFSLIIPYVRFKSQSRPENISVLDTSAIIDGRVADLIESKFLEGTVVIPQFVLKELQKISDSADAAKRARGRRGLEMLNRLQKNPANEIKIHEADFPDEPEVDSKLVRLTRNLGGKLYTTDYNLGKVAELQAVPYVNLTELALALKPAVIPGEALNLRLTREGKEKGQAVGYLADGTMVVVNAGQTLIGQQVRVEVQHVVQTGAGVIIFAEIKAQAA